MKKIFDTCVDRVIPFLSLQLFAEAGSVVNTTGGYTNAYTGQNEQFAGENDLTPGMKSFYNTALLENARDTLIYQQLGREQNLPEGHGKVVEWRKFNTLPDADRLQEAVIPEGKKLGQTSMQVEVAQYGEYVTISDVVDVVHVDPILQAAIEELGAAAGRTAEKLVRNTLSAGTNVLFADVYDADGNYVSTPSTRQALKDALAGGNNANLTPDMIAKAVTILNKANAKKFSGKEYLGVISPSSSYDLRKSDYWIEAHKYASPDEIYNGEIGKMHSVRFVESNMSPIIKEDGDAQAIYQPMIFGEGAFAVVNPSGLSMRMIHKTSAQIGGPLEQFGTIGFKFATASKILYPERMVIIECGSEGYGTVDEDNMGNAA